MKQSPLSKANSSNRESPHVRDGDEARFFGHTASRETHRVADRTREERLGGGSCTGIYDPRYFSNSGGASDVKLTDGRRVGSRDRDGHPVFSDNLSAGSHAAADAIRRRER